MNPLAVAQAQAARDNKALDALFARYIGSAEHPRGRVLVAYRNARRAMMSALQEPGLRRGLAVREVLDGLRRELAAAGSLLYQEAASRGHDSAQRQVRAYLADDPTFPWIGDQADTGPLVMGWLAQVDAQLAVLEALAQGGDLALLLGDDNRVGAMSPAPLATEAAWWAAIALLTGIRAYLYGRDGRGRERAQYNKQAVAAIDHRTTDCCLRVHGQVQALDTPFRLTGEPRFADRLDWPPFHWWCRTSVALYLPKYDDELTVQMRGAARRELDARKATGTTQLIWPSHARSGRGG